ncbi:ArsI/CadI family heavy metal resistance metalloenzyme [Pelagibius sp. Alg239-R121]|uniref:ArsI/CadI family heavy metal resistance metalloenzyme n=1 Tax=Pelagibius sp. Alg239-R121 TaxID=2993448 RepID=UPI0024A64D2C|nr:ArsI/CadI family heavy metal resistance metalloenzyme [Pelagibius sp. Alg239-R121]
MRLQLALNVRDIDEAVDYYSKLFDCQPHKRRPGYANFAITQPPLKLVLFENRDASERLNHLGVEVFDADVLANVAQRLETAGSAGKLEFDQVCCHAAQDKIWSQEPQGLSWEWYRITDDTPKEEPQRSGAVCCSGEQGAEMC